MHEDWKILSPCKPQQGKHVLFDIGSHHGWFFHCWKDWCPEAEIHAFEPSREAYETSLRLYGRTPGLTVNNVAVGAKEGHARLHVLTKSRVSNSLLPPATATWEKIGYETGELETETVTVTTLDRYRRDKRLGPIHLIKIDVQGFELKVLKGAEETLRHTDYVFVESALKPLYKGAPRFGEVVDFLLDHGFDLLTLRAWHRGNGVLIETDLLFRRAELAPPPWPAGERDREYCELTCS